MFYSILGYVVEKFVSLDHLIHIENIFAQFSGPCSLKTAMTIVKMVSYILANATMVLFMKLERNRRQWIQWSCGLCQYLPIEMKRDFFVCLFLQRFTILLASIQIFFWNQRGYGGQFIISIQQFIISFNTKIKNESMPFIFSPIIIVSINKLN